MTAIAGQMEFFNPAARAEDAAIPMSQVGSGLATRLPDDFYVEQRFSVVDARGEPCSLDVQGYALFEHPSCVVDFFNDSLRSETYAREMERLLIDATGACRVVVFDQTIRVRIVSTQRERGVREVVTFAHADLTESSGPGRLHALLGDEEADAYLASGKRYAVFNAWRSVCGPVGAMPLALADAQTVSPSHFVPTALLYGDRTGEIYHVLYGPEQRWVYFSSMTPDEVLVFKTFDSARDGRARFVPHAAFSANDDRGAERQSIEVRALALFD